MDYLKELNESQRKAVKHIEGPLMIIAGPGSGKTRVLTYRIAHLIEQGIDPFNILSLTFTNKAAREMRERIEQIKGMEARNIWMGTFHSVFARILRVESDRIGYPSNFSIYDTQDSRNLIKNIVKEQGLNDKLYKANIVQFRISNAKNSLIGPQAYQSNPDLTSEDESNGRPKIGKIYEIYAQRCFQSGAMDFDDLLMKTYELINKYPDILLKYQDKFRYILIDEYQDTNFAQYLITKTLADRFQNICVVGDDAQSIYSFRGANIQNILNFERDYPDLKVFKLEQNYRSSQQIVKAANEIISKNKNQLPKTIWTENQDGDRIKIRATVSDSEEGRQISAEIQDLRTHERIPASEFAILYRTNAQSRSFEEGLRRLNIPYKIYGGLSFYQRKEVKDLVAYLKLVVNPKDEESLRRVINYPKRGIGQTTVEKLTVIANEHGRSIWQVIENIQIYPLSSRVVNQISDFVNMIKSFQTMLKDKDAFELAMHIAKSTKLLQELGSDKTVEGLSRFENIQELLNGIKEFAEQDEVVQDEDLPSDRGLGAYLQNVSLLTDQDEKEGDEERVKLMTIHAAKGLEFENVFVVGMEENLFPSQMAMNSREELEEERRLFYVAATRAKQRLSLSYATTRYRFGDLQYQEPSRFLEDIPIELTESIGRRPEVSTGIPRDIRNPWGSFESGSREKRHVVKPQAAPPPKPKHQASSDFKPDDTAELQSGMEVEHMKFGFGKVLNVEGNGPNKIATIHFNGLGQKKVMLKFAKLKIRNKSV
ncbi:MAG: UvrD-helicase domain-containing protein [Chitinophagales bacterium]